MDAGKRPLDDEFDRATFYRGPDPEDDGEEYELAPLDESLAEAERQRAREAVEQAQLAVDMRQLEEAERGLGQHDAEDYLKHLKGVKFQFGVKHLLIAMAALGVMLVVGMVVNLVVVMVLGTLAVLAAAYAYITWKDLQAREELEQRRAELYARKRAQNRMANPPDR
jgi:hypothetical protein